MISLILFSSNNFKKNGGENVGIDEIIDLDCFLLKCQKFHQKLIIFCDFYYAHDTVFSKKLKNYQLMYLHIICITKSERYYSLEESAKQNVKLHEKSCPSHDFMNILNLGLGEL